MKRCLVVALLIISPYAKAQSLCGPRISKYNCDMTIRSAVSDKDNKTLEGLLAKKGVKAFFDYLDPTGHYAILETAQIFNNSRFISIIIARPDFSTAIIDKNRFLKTILQPGENPLLEAGMVNSLVNNKDSSKNLNWFERSDWPYPLLAGMREKNDPQLIKRLDKINDLKKNICQVRSLDQLIATEKEFRGFVLGLKYPENDLLYCATKAGDGELVAYLLKEGLFSPKNLTKLMTHFESTPMSEENLKLFKLVATQMRESKIPFPQSKKKENTWTITHWDDLDELCLLKSHSATITEAKSFLDLSEKLIWMSFLGFVKDLRTALSQKNHGASAKAIKEISNLIKESGLSLNYQDQDGKSIMHHLAEFADTKTIEAVEKGLNNIFITMDPTLQDKNGNTPLHIALLNQNMEGSETLADFTMLTNKGDTSQLRSDVVMKNRNGKTPADLAKALPKVDIRKKEQIQEWIKLHTSDVKRAQRLAN